MLLAGIMFNRDYRREQGHLKDIFLQRGEVLIHSLELVGRVRFGAQLEEAHLLAFWNNLEDGDNVLFLTLTDEKGRPLAQAGELTPDPSVFKDPQPQVYGEGPIAPNYRLEKIGDRWVYLVYRRFWPMPRPKPLFKEGPHHSAGRQPRPGPDWRRLETPGPDRDPAQTRLEFPLRYMWVGFDLSPLEKISHRRVRTAAVFIGLFCLAGLAGVLALIWGHNSRLARQMYQDTNALAAELIGRLPSGVIIVDCRGRITLVNRSTLNISGLTERDFLGRTLPDLTYGLFPREETLAGRELDLEFNGGHKVRVALTSGPVVSDDGHPLGRVILMEDLGELGRLKAELGKKERLAVLGRLAAGLAHEIRNPLGAIRGLSQHLLSKGPSDPADREALEVMLASVDRLNSTITDFLAYSRPAEAKPETLELAELLRKMSVLAAHDARAGDVAVDLDLPAEPVLIDGDEALLSQAFLNLYLNAIEAAGGRAEGGGRLTVTLKNNDQRALLTFRDDGPGFNSEQLAQPFVPYFTTKAEGTGLGLALVEKTIRAHDGADISLASPPGGGALISISFNLKTDQLGDRPERESQP
jgi:two-component system sensor histidine kinase HydH